jgi:hypothetical protein
LGGRFGSDALFYKLAEAAGMVLKYEFRQKGPSHLPALHCTVTVGDRSKTTHARSKTATAILGALTKSASV